VADATPVTVDAWKEGSLLIAALQAEVAQLRLESSTTISELHQALQALREENPSVVATPVRQQDRALCANKRETPETCPITGEGGKTNTAC
jgi:DNA-binding IclR family transcriptional regulator